MKEFIEIPFGAKDSELGGWEYTIPKGFVASIENGKIIVKKEEGEDEKIRKEIIEYLRFKYEDPNAIRHDYEKWIAWLEKQREQNPTDYPLAHEKMETERWGQACKAACCDRNYRSHHGLTETRDDYFVDGVHWADEHPKQNSAWSEEDERNLKCIMKIIKEKAFADYDVDEDNNMLGIYGILESWLKSLKPQPQWKPSEEQIQALEYQVNSTYKGSWQYKASKELLEQLKKL